MSDPAAPRPALYARVSTSEQIEGYSLDAQIRAVEDFCRARGWPAPVVYADEGRSAYTDSTEKRPAFAAMLDAAEAGEHDTIIVHKLDRFARSLIVTLRELQRLERAGVAFVSVSENMDFTQPIGRVLLALLASFAEYYSRNLSAETKKGLREKRRQGYHIGPVPYGGHREGGHLRVDPARADDLRLVYGLLATMPAQAVADELNARGFPGPAGGVWYEPQLVRMRKDKGSWLREQGAEWRDLFDRAHGRATFATVRHGRQIHMLSGLMRCPCGGGIIYHEVTVRKRDGVEMRHGRCKNLVAPKVGGCRDWGRTINEVEAAVTAWLLALPPPDIRHARALDGTAREAFDARRRRVAGLRRDGLLDDAEYEAEKLALFAEESRLPLTAARVEVLGRGLGEAQRLWPHWDDIARNRYLRGLVTAFRVEHGTVAPLWRPHVASAWSSPD